MRSVHIFVRLIAAFGLLVLIGAGGSLAEDELDLSIIKTLSKGDGSKRNWIIGLTSITSLMDQIYLGTGGDTKEKLGEVLHVKDLSELREKQADIADSNAKGVTWRKAGMMLVRNSITIKDSFKTESSSIFSTEIKETDFKQPRDDVKSINSWVSNKTEGVIKSLLSPGDIGPDSEMILLNAVYFKGSWKYSFSKDWEPFRCFYSESKVCTETQMMTQKREFKYGNNERLDAQIIQLPYNDERYSMMIVLPNKQDGLSYALNHLDGDLLKFLDEMKMETVEITMPKFKAKYKLDISSLLSSVELEFLLNPKADYSGISLDPLSLSSIIHKATISVNEKGTVAAASTGAIMARMFVEEPEFKEMNVDHPFFYLLLKDNKHVLFAGQYIK